MRLTDRQREIFLFIRDHIESIGWAPSLRDIGRRFDISSTNGVTDHLSRLEAKGYIRRGFGKSRAIRILREAS